MLQYQFISVIVVENSIEDLIYYAYKMYSYCFLVLLYRNWLKIIVHTQKKNVCPMFLQWNTSQTFSEAQIFQLHFVLSNIRITLLSESYCLLPANVINNNNQITSLTFSVWQEAEIPTWRICSVLVEPCTRTRAGRAPRREPYLR